MAKYTVVTIRRTVPSGVAGEEANMLPLNKTTRRISETRAIIPTTAEGQAVKKLNLFGLFEETHHWYISIDAGADISANIYVLIWHNQWVVGIQKTYLRKKKFKSISDINTTSKLAENRNAKLIFFDLNAFERKLNFFHPN